MKTDTILKSNGPSRIYHRSTFNELKPTNDKSLQYSRSQAAQIFSRYPGVNLVEYVNGGRKLDSQIMNRGDDCAPYGCYVIVSSTGGKWGRSRKDYSPSNH